MADRLTEAFNALRAGGAVFAGRVRLTGWSDSSRGMLGTFRLDASADPLDNPATHPFKGAHCSPKDGHEFMLLVIPVASEEAKPDAPPATEPEPQAAPEEPKERRRITDMTFAARAAMLCQEKDAKGRNLAAAFFAERSPRDWNMATGATDEARADHCLKLIMGITSKCQIDANPDLATDFDRISRRFHAWRQEPVA